jgi:circadian clock protein KaiC
VVLLDHRVLDQVSTRRLRIVKYRGSAHGTNEYPFLIDEDGISVLPITSLGLKHEASEERISTGIARLDAMLGGGFYRGTSILISGTAGTGKSSLAASMTDAACRRGERCLYFAFEEAPAQIVRNMRSIGLNLGRWTANGLLQFHAQRPSLYGLEMHLAVMHKAIEDAKPSVVVIDPISNLSSGGTLGEAGAMLVRIIDFLKVKGITTLLTNLTSDAAARESTDVGVSSLVDSWILLRDIELGGERNRGLYIIKSRGTAHSNQIREFLLTNQGIDLLDVYVGPEGVLTGSMRLAQEARERAANITKSQEDDRRGRLLERKRKAIAAQIAALEAELLAEEAEAVEDAEKLSQRLAREAQQRHEMSRSRKADGNGESSKPTKVGDQG